MTHFIALVGIARLSLAAIDPLRPRFQSGFPRERFSGPGSTTSRPDRRASSDNPDCRIGVFLMHQTFGFLKFATRAATAPVWPLLAKRGSALPIATANRREPSDTIRRSAYGWNANPWENLQKKFGQKEVLADFVPKPIVRVLCCIHQGPAIRSVHVFDSWSLLGWPHAGKT